jgi:hypothetical protein
MKSYIFYALRVVVFSLIIAAIVLLLQGVFNPYWIHEKVNMIIWFYFGLTLVSGLFTLYLLKINKENSVPILLGAGLIRLLASLMFFFLILWSGTGNLLWFVVDFFVIYLLYLLFDIYTFITNLRPHSK